MFVGTWYILVTTFTYETDDTGTQNGGHAGGGLRIRRCHTSHTSRTAQDFFVPVLSFDAWLCS